LYTGICNYETVSSIWKTHNGTEWEYVYMDGFEDLGNTGVWGMAKYQGDLVIGTGNESGGEVWRSGD
jgi:hypothetical protein